eukprot:1139635-Pelagomonas_calceolata.AAC.1
MIRGKLSPVCQVTKPEIHYELIQMQRSLTVQDSGTYVKPAAAWTLHFDTQLPTSDQPDHQIGKVLVDWSLCNKRISLQKEWSDKTQWLGISGVYVGRKHKNLGVKNSLEVELWAFVDDLRPGG